MLATFVFGILVTFLMGSSYGQYAYTHSASFVHSGPISVSQVNGVSKYVIDGITLDLSRARVVGENSELRVLQPQEVPAARVSVYKHRNSVAIDYAGHHFESTQNGLVSRQWAR